MVSVQWLSKCSFRPQADKNRIEESVCPSARAETSLPWPRTQSNILLTRSPVPSAAQAQFKIDPQEISCISFTQVLHECNSVAFSSFILDLHWAVTYSLDTENWVEEAKAPYVLVTHQEHTTRLSNGSSHPYHSARPCPDLAHANQRFPR